MSTNDERALVPPHWSVAIARLWVAAEAEAAEIEPLLWEGDNA